MNPDQPNSKRESGDDRRVAIALAARQIIVEKGLEGLRTRDIAARVGINIATLHYHVPSKEALVALVAESIRHDFRAQSMRHPREGKSALEQIHLEFDDFRETVRDMPELIIILTELGERARRDSAVAAIVTPLHQFWRNQFVEIYRLGIADGSFRPDLDPEGAALITTGAMSDCWRQSTVSRVDRLELVLAELERAFFRKS
ncbi:TetR/AcrR family transcriptional regulator [Devosia sp. Root635]|uniref:TetR/AcrR family transcriptional regulator n=1 Tax=Devosia sp. Root635 TaxID=1736575 RepID=UPI000AAF918C|nr:TetR/AcrR family transcriptional regulator [Devosia sp. Root635]